MNLRTSLASSFKELIQILEIDKMNQEERKYFVELLNHFLQDTDDIQAKVLPTMCSLISKFPGDEKNQLLETLIKEKIESIKNMKNVRDNMIKMFE